MQVHWNKPKQKQNKMVKVDVLEEFRTSYVSGGRAPDKPESTAFLFLAASLCIIYRVQFREVSVCRRACPYFLFTNTQSVNGVCCCCSWCRVLPRSFGHLLTGKSYKQCEYCNLSYLTVELLLYILS